MVNKKRILLVEGESDRGFFELICKKLGLDNSVLVAEPKVLNGSHNTKEGVYKLLPNQLSQLSDGQIERLAVVVDADSEPNGGLEKTLARVSQIVEPLGYTLSANFVGGLVYQHDDGLADFGLWVMPDNSQNGMLEDWIKQTIQPSEQALFSHAASVISALPKPTKFKAIHQTKAEVATWMAWQSKPGHGLYRAIEDGLLDENSQPYLDMSQWLSHIFKL